MGAGPKPRILCFSAHRTNLRAAAIAAGLEEAGCMVRRPAVWGRPSGLAELLWTLLPHCALAMTAKAELAIGFKPHLNVTIPLVICWLRGIPAWIDVDDLDHAYRTGWLSRLIAWSQRPFPRWCQVVSYHNPTLRSYLINELGCWPGQLMRVRQGVSGSQFGQRCPAQVREARRRQLGIRDRRVAVFAAHLNVACDLETVLTAWCRVIRVIPDATLLVVGDGPRAAQFRRRAVALGLASWVVFVGAVDHGEVPSYLAAADIAIAYATPRLVNRYRCSLKLREYLAAGLRVACNDVGELADFARYTYQTRSDLGVFADQIVTLLAGGGDGREREARETVLAELDWSVIVEEVRADLWHRLGVRTAIGTDPSLETPTPETN